MSTEQNKAVVRRFITETLDGGNVDVIDELFAPNYVNRAMGGMDVAGFKATLAAMAAAIPGREFEIADLVAEGDAVVARFSFDVHPRQWGEDLGPGPDLLRSRQRQDHRRRPDHHAGPDADAWAPAGPAARLTRPVHVMAPPGGHRGSETRAADPLAWYAYG